MENDFKGFLERMRKRSERVKEMLRRNKEPLLEALKKLEASTVIIEYAGSGDEGHIEQITVADKDSKAIDIEDINITVWTMSSRLMGEGFTDDFKEEEENLETALNDFASEWIYAEHAGWENNDGASGAVVIDVSTGEFKLNHTEYYTESSDFEYKL